MALIKNDLFFSYSWKNGKDKVEHLYNKLKTNLNHVSANIKINNVGDDILGRDT
jgi:hypothetical protein